MARVVRRLLLSCAALCLVSCLSPTLPLPPPGRPDVTASETDGFVRLQGFAAPRVEVLAWNHDNDLIAGQVTGADSRYDFLLQAEPGDVVELWYIQGSDESQSVKFSVDDLP